MTGNAAVFSISYVCRDVFIAANLRKLKLGAHIFGKFSRSFDVYKFVADKLCLKDRKEIKDRADHFCPYFCAVLCPNMKKMA